MPIINHKAKTPTNSSWVPAAQLPPPGVEVAYDHQSQRFVLPDGTPITNMMVNEITVVQDSFPSYNIGGYSAGSIPGMRTIEGKVTFTELMIHPKPVDPPVVLDRDKIIKSAIASLVDIKNIGS